jgi:hypothetical protein
VVIVAGPKLDVFQGLTAIVDSYGPIPLVPGATGVSHFPPATAAFSNMATCSQAQLPAQHVHVQNAGLLHDRAQSVHCPGAASSLIMVPVWAGLPGCRSRMPVKWAVCWASGQAGMATRNTPCQVKRHTRIVLPLHGVITRHYGTHSTVHYGTHSAGSCRLHWCCSLLSMKSRSHGPSLLHHCRDTDFSERQYRTNADGCSRGVRQPPGV